MVLPVLVLPRLFGMDGVWYSLAAGEIMSIAMSIYYFLKYRCMWQKPETAESGTRAANMEYPQNNFGHSEISSLHFGK